jgi:DNA invertase Pin-like site-specific DNA recombinase
MPDMNGEALRQHLVDSGIKIPTIFLKRQLEGIAKAKAAGVYKGRPASIDPAQIRQLKAQGIGPSQIAKKLGIARASVYRALEG